MRPTDRVHRPSHRRRPRTALLAATATAIVTVAAATPAAAALEFSSDVVDFGAVDNLATSDPRSVTVTNDDAPPVSLGNVTVGAQFEKGDDGCSGTSLASGASCVVAARFAPTAVGAKSSNLRIAGYSPLGPRLVGESIGRSVGTSPVAVAFPQAAAGTAVAPQAVRLANAGNGPVVVSAVELAGIGADGFAIVDDGCSGATVAPDASCTVGVRPLGARPGWRTASLRFATDASPATVVTQVSARTGTALLDDQPAAPFDLAAHPVAELAGEGEDAVGGALAGPCDVDGDGHADLVAGASTWSRHPADLSWEGAAYVTFGGPGFGSADLQDLGRARALRIEGEDTTGWHPATGSQTGSVDCAGDVNGDGIDDLAIGAWNYHYEGRDTNAIVGRAYVVFGSRDLRDVGTLDLGRLGVRGFRIEAPNLPQYDHLGIAVAGVGDLDGDGLDDVAVAANVADTEVDPARSGMAYVVPGRRGTTAVDLAADGATLMRINHGIPGPATGSSGQMLTLVGAGDVNGDGTPDIAYGSHTAQAFGASRSAAGLVAVISGRARGTVDVAARDHLLLAAGGAFASHRLGIGLGAAGDVNGDGRADLVVGADSTAAANSDAAYVLYGQRDADPATLDTAQLPPDRGYRILGAPGSAVGYGATGVGDVDGDGADDLLVGGYGTASGAGAAWLLRGIADASTLPPNDGTFGLTPANASDTTRTQRLDGLPAADGGRIDGGHRGDRFGRAVAHVGDVLGDGGTALAVGSDGAVRHGRTRSGAASVVTLPGAASAAQPDPGPDPGSPSPPVPQPSPDPAPARPAPATPKPAAPVVRRPSSVDLLGRTRTFAVRGRTLTLSLRRIAGPTSRVRLRVRTRDAVRRNGRRAVVDVVRARSVRVARDGRLKVRVPLTAAGRQLLRDRRRLSVRLTIAPGPGVTGRTVSRTLTLRIARAK